MSDSDRDGEDRLGTEEVARRLGVKRETVYAYVSRGRLASRRSDDGRGSVFFIGDWWTLPGDIGSHRYEYKHGKESYPRLDRGQFFAVTEVSTGR